MNRELTESAANNKTEGDNSSAGRKACTYSREKRSIYSGLESLEQRSARLSKQRIRNRKNQALKTEEEKRIQRDIFNAQMRKRRASESSNQKFWRLIRRRQYRKHGVHLLCVEFQYHRSKNQYGLNNNDVSDRDNTGNSSNIIEVTDIGMKTVFSIFYELLDLAIRCQTIPEERLKIFDHYGICVPNNFFEDYYEDITDLTSEY